MMFNLFRTPKNKKNNNQNKYQNKNQEIDFYSNWMKNPQQLPYFSALEVIASYSNSYPFEYTHKQWICNGSIVDINFDNLTWGIYNGNHTDVFLFFITSEMFVIK